MGTLLQWRAVFVLLPQHKVRVKSGVKAGAKVGVKVGTKPRTGGRRKVGSEGSGEA
jgi:hypothetical protein